MPRVNMAGRTIPVPRSRGARLLLGVGFVLFGIVGFLPVVGFWMVPVGLVILSMDIPAVRRFRRRSEVWLLRRIRAWRAERQRVRRIQDR